MTAEAKPAGTPIERRWRLSPTPTIRFLRVVLWLLVVSGPATALLVATRLSALDERLDVVTSRTAVEPAAATAGAEGFAELFIAAYLSAGEDSTGLDGFLEGVSLDGVEGGQWSVTRTASLGAEEVAPGYYAVTVAAEVVANDHDAEGTPLWVSQGTWFFSVGVEETPTGWKVTGLPSLIPAPASVEAPELLVDRLEGVEPGIEELLSRFLAAYLASEGELARYVSPSSAIVSVQPPPFAHVEVMAAGTAATNDSGTHVAAVARATDADGRTQLLEYSLVVSQRDGRWEVSALLPAPPLQATNTD
jgi:hypothetical protein